MFPLYEMDTVIKDLEEAAQYEGTEVGEAWTCLINLWEYRDCISEVFVEQLEIELHRQHMWFKDNFRWIEHEEGACDACGRDRSKYRELVFNDDL